MASREEIARIIAGDIFGSPDSAVGPATKSARIDALTKADAILAMTDSKDNQGTPRPYTASAAMQQAVQIVKTAREVYELHDGDGAWLAMEQAYARLISDALALAQPASDTIIQLQARPADGGDWINIFPEHLYWMAKEANDVRAIESAAPHTSGYTATDDDPELAELYANSSPVPKECQFPNCGCPGSPLDPICAVTRPQRGDGA